MPLKVNSSELYDKMSKETVDCNVCGSKEHLKVFDKCCYEMGIDTVLCKTCGFMFTNPRPTEEEMNRFYERNYRKTDLSAAKLVGAYAETSNKYRRAQWLFELTAAELAHDGIEAPVVLDVGCGSGIVLHQFRQNMPQSRLYGIEPSGTYGQYAAEQNQAQIYRGDLNAFARERRELLGSFHVIILNHVLEHLFHPVDKLKLLREFLTENGILLIQVPNAFSKECPSALKMFQLAHVSQFSPPVLERALRFAGFDRIQPHASAPRVQTVLARKAAQPISLAPDRLTAEHAMSLARGMQEKIAREYEKKNPHRQNTSFMARVKFSVKNLRGRLTRDRLLGRLIRGQTVVIVGKNDPAVGANLTDAMKILCYDEGVKWIGHGLPARGMDLYLCGGKILSKKRLKEALSALKTRVWLTDNLKLAKKKKELVGRYEKLCFDESAGDRYLRRLIGRQNCRRLRDEYPEDFLPTFRLLQIAIYYGAREIFLAGVELPEKRYLWEPDEHEDTEETPDLHETFARILSERYSHIFVCTPESRLAGYFPFKDLAAKP